MEANGGRERRALTYDDRLEIERGLNRGDRIAWIARTIGRAPKVVADEVRRNWTDDPQGMLVVRTRNICTKAAGCQARGLCKGMWIGYTKLDSFVRAGRVRRSPWRTRSTPGISPTSSSGR